MKFLAILTFVAAMMTVAMAVPGITKCQSAKKPEDTDVDIEKCETPPCPLKRRTTVHLNFKITPDTDVKKLTNTVFGNIAGLPLPFIGVDNTDACKSIYNAAGEHVGCPLQAGQAYTYKNEIKVLPVYPRVPVTVHWALTAENRKDIFCFEVPAKITG